MQRRTVLIAGAAMLAGSALPVAARARGDAAGARAILATIDSVRGAQGLPSLTLCRKLVTMARRQTVRMLDLHETTHTDGRDGDPVTRARACGYPGHVLGEALAESGAGAVDTATLWLSHPVTRAVLLDPRAREVGIFGLRDASGVVWWDLVVGDPPRET